jgi:hypothetical protein
MGLLRGLSSTRRKTFLGTKVYGGRCGADGIGATVYELVPRRWRMQRKLLWSFNDTDGARPLDSVIMDSAGNHRKVSQIA